MIEGYTRRAINVDIDQKHQEKVEADVNILFQLKQIDRIIKSMAIWVYQL